MATDPPPRAQTADAQSPEAYLGRPVGTDFELADWEQVSGWYRQLGAASARVQVQTLGKSTEGRDFLLATIASEANLARLDEIRAATARIADPRGLSADERAELIANTPLVLFMTCSMHSTETAGTEFGMSFAWSLATSDAEPFASARRDLVVVIVPTLNPDGLDSVVHWYRENVGTPFEGTGLLDLYQHYAGHDNNRDWFGLSQVETRLVTEQIYSVWHPQVYWDVHQQGSSEERLFVPPYRDPLNPNLDPGVISGIDALGSRALWDLTRTGFTGVSTGVSYDMWWNGGNRNVPVRHNIIGLLTEAASVNIASPIFLEHGSLRAPGDLDGYAPSNRFPDPWPGGWWRLSDIIRYERAFGESLIGSLSRDREALLDNALAAAERALQAGRDSAPTAWLLPSDNANGRSLRRLVDILLMGGVEVDVANAEFQADGRTYPQGTLVIRQEQPYGAHIKDLFEVQRYPDGAAPYDVAGWTLPILFGLRRVEVVGPLDVETKRITSAEGVNAAMGRAGFDLNQGVDGLDGDMWAEVFAELKAGATVALVTGGDEQGMLRLGAAETEAKNDALIDGLINANGKAHDQSATKSLVANGLPRIGLYSPWSGTMNEGWLRWVFDTYGVEFVTVRNEMIRAGNLHDFLDVLILPSVGSWTIDGGRAPGSVADRYTRGLDPEGAIAVEEFVRTGGNLIAMESSARWANDLFELGLSDVSRDGGFSCPGSVLRSVPTDESIAAGLPTSLQLFFSRGAAWSLDKKNDEITMTVPLRYASERVLYSGWIQNSSVIEKHAAWVHAEVEAGDVHLLGFRPQYRSWSEASFQVLFRAILFGSQRNG